VRTLIRIDHRDYLVPAGVNAAKLFDMVTKLQPVSDRSYSQRDPHVRVSKDAIDVELKSIPPRVKLLKGDEQPPSSTGEEPPV